MSNGASDLRDRLNTVILGRVPWNVLSDYQFIKEDSASSLTCHDFVNRRKLA